jgi:hypothetical protein
MTNHLIEYAGSELVLAEFAELLLARGWTVEIVCPFLDDPMKSEIDRLGIECSAEPAEARPLEYDLVYAQHGLLALADFADRGRDRPQSILLGGHLSPFNGMELISIGFEKAVADRLVCNSHETARRLRELGVPKPMTFVAHNAAPPAFFKAVRHRPAKHPLRILFVSNHPPEEVVACARLLAEAGHVVRAVGRRSGGAERIRPETIDAADAVVTIGKTVQYALGMRVPAFVYDRFGGPGYLNESNLMRAGWHNFSGRCCGDKMTAEQLAEAIAAGYADAWRFVRTVPKAALARFNADTLLNRLLQVEGKRPAERRAALQRARQTAARERIARELVLDKDRRGRRAEAKLQAARTAPAAGRSRSARRGNA